MKSNIFSYVKEHILISDFVESLGVTNSLKSVGHGKWRCNNIIAGGTNSNAMSIDDDTGYFKMFSHGQESGDIINLYQLTMGSGKSPKEAAVELASFMGLKIPEELLLSPHGGGVSKSAMTEAMDKLSLSLNDYLINSNNDDAVAAREYMEERGLSIDVATRWKLGLFPSSQMAARSIILECGDESIFVSTGVLSKSSKGKGKKTYVPMMGRLAFPIMNRAGKTISFSSRSIPGVDHMNENSKYINTSSTDIYDKSSVLYGQHLLKKNIKNIVICEGNFDVIALNEGTDSNTVALATCGTALTEGHANLLKSTAPEKTCILFDSDKAGRDATAKLIWLVNVLDNVSSSSLREDEGKDPWDAFIAGVDFHAVIDDSTPIIQDAVRSKSQTEGRQAFIDWVADVYPTVKFFDDKRKLLEHASHYGDVSKGFLETLVQSSKAVKSGSSRKRTSAISPPVKDIIAAMLIYSLEERELVFYPFYDDRITDDSFDVIGVNTQEDEEAIMIASGLNKDGDAKISAEVYSLLPSSEKMEECKKRAAKVIALSTVGEWRTNGVPEHGGAFISALSTLAYGETDASGDDALCLAMEATVV